MSRQHDDLKRIQAAFIECRDSAPPLMHSLVVGGNSANIPWQQIVSEAAVSTTWSSSFLTQGGTKSGWSGCLWFPREAEPDLAYEKDMVSCLRQLNRLAEGLHELAPDLQCVRVRRTDLTVLPGLPYGSGDAFVDWIYYIHELAWNECVPQVSADLFRVYKVDAGIEKRRCDHVGAIIESTDELLFPHRFCCVLEPDLFSTSAYVIDVILSDIDGSSGREAVAETPVGLETTMAPEGEWSVPMPKMTIMSRLNLNPRAFETFAKQHGLQKISRQQWQIRLDKMDLRTRQRIETGR